MKGLLKKLNKVLGGKMFLLFLFTFIFLITTVLGNIGDSGYSGIQVENYFSGSGKQGINQNISFNDSENNNYFLDFEDGLLVNYTKTIPPEPSVWDGLVAYYRLDEISGTNVEDSYDNQDGIANGTSWVTGKINNSIQSDNSTDNINLGSIDSLSSGTISMWLYPTSVGTGQFILQKDYSGTSIGDFNFQLKNTGKLAFQDNTGVERIVSNKSLANNNWYHFVFTWEDSSVIMYINNTQEGMVVLSPTLFGTVVGNDTEFFYWTFGSAGGFQGKLDEVGIWNRALNSTEVATLYNNGEGLTYSP